ncbi:type II secretion system protein GspD, partial [Deinococcus saxicola]
AQAQTPAPPPRAASALSVQLPANAKLDAKLTLNLPTGADLSTVLSAVARAGGLTLLARDVPPLRVTTKLSGVTVRQALETLLSVYADQIGARLLGNTLIVAPPAVIAGLEPVQAPVRRVIPGTLSAEVAAQISALSGAQIISAGQSTILSGTAAQLTDAADLVLGSMAGSVPAPAKTAEQPPQASAAVTPPAPQTVRRTVSSGLDAGLVTRISEALGGIKLTALDSGTYLIAGTTEDLDAFAAAISAAEVRERLRVLVVYPEKAAQAARLSSLMPTLSVAVSGTALEVRGTPQQQVQASALLASYASKTTAAEPVTVRLSLAYASGSSIVAQLSALYGEAGAATSGAADTSIGASSAADGASRTGADSAGAAISSPSPAARASSATLTGGVRALADPRTQSVILTGPEAAVARVRRTVLDLDSRVQDVRMALKIEQVSGTDGQDLGVNWKVGVGGLSIGQSAGTLSAGFTPGALPLTLEASLNAARSQGRAKTLLDTTFVAQNGLTSNFKNGGQLLLTTQATATANGTSTTTSSTTTYNYGLSVLLTPRLAPDGRVELSVQLQIGQPPRTTGPGTVVIESQNLNTTSTLMPGQPLILGSVLTATDNAGQKGVPVLSQIPVIGPLFGTQTRSASSAVLLITVQAAASSDSRAPAPPVMDTSGSGVTRITIPGR